MNKPQERCEDIVKYIIKSDPGVFKDLNTKKLASMFDVNRSYLSRTFKKFQGVKLEEWLKRIKMLKIAFLILEKKQLKINQIAKEFGYESKNYFIKDFKKFFLTSPGKFKKFLELDEKPGKNKSKRARYQKMT